MTKPVPTARPVSLLEHHENKVVHAKADAQRKRKAAHARRVAQRREAEREIRDLARKLNGLVYLAGDLVPGHYVLATQPFPGAAGMVDLVHEEGDAVRIEFRGRSRTSDYVGIGRRDLVVVQVTRQPTPRRRSAAGPAEHHSQAGRRARRAGNGWTA